MALVTFLRTWRQFEPDRTQEISDGVADVLVQRGIAVYVTQDSDVEEPVSEKEEATPSGVVTKDVKKTDGTETQAADSSKIAVKTRDVPGPKDARRTNK